MSRAVRYTQRVVPAVVSIVALGFLLATVDLGKAWESVTWKVAAILVPSLLVYGAVTLVLEAASILRLVVPQPPEFGLWTAARVKCASYLLGIVHYALGVGALTVLLRRRAARPLGEAASIVLLISFADLLVVLAMAASGAALYETGAPTVRAGLLASVGVGFFGGLALLRTPRSLGPLDRIRSLGVFEALRTVPTRRLGELLALRASFSLCFVAIAGIAFAAFGLHPPLSQLVVGMMIIAVVAALPIAVAGIGTSQAATVYIFADVGDEATVLALSLVLSAGMILMRALMGLVVAREYTREALAQTRGEAA